MERVHAAHSFVKSRVAARDYSSFFQLQRLSFRENVEVNSALALALALGARPQLVYLGCEQPGIRETLCEFCGSNIPSANVHGNVCAVIVVMAVGGGFVPCQRIPPQLISYCVGKHEISVSLVKRLRNCGVCVGILAPLAVDAGLDP